MNTKLIRERLKKSSEAIDKSTNDSERFQAVQDFQIWLLGYLDGLNESTNTIVSYELKSTEEQSK